MASRPAMVMTIDSTVAKIGRSMKNREMFMAGSPDRRRGGAVGPRRGTVRRGEGGLDLHPGPDPGEPVHHDLLARLEPVPDDAALAIHLPAQGDAPVGHGAVRLEHEHELAVLVGADRDLGDHDHPPHSRCRSGEPARTSRA